MRDDVSGCAVGVRMITGCSLVWLRYPLVMRWVSDSCTPVEDDKMSEETLHRQPTLRYAVTLGQVL